MDDEQKQLKAISRGTKAKVTLQNESIVNAFEYLETEYIKGWKSCNDPTGRDRWWQGIQVLEKVKEHLAIAIRNGEVSKKILESIEGNRRSAA